MCQHIRQDPESGSLLKSKNLPCGLRSGRPCPKIGSINYLTLVPKVGIVCIPWRPCKERSKLFKRYWLPHSALLQKRLWCFCLPYFGCWRMKYGCPGRQSLTPEKVRDRQRPSNLDRQHQDSWYIIFLVQDAKLARISCSAQAKLSNA